jgi:hypothetical protein
MRYVTAFGLFILLSGHNSEAQVLPTSNGSCGITASGVESCNWISAITLRKAATTKTADTFADSRPKLLVTRCILAPGAPLNPLVEGTDVLIVGMNNGELVNEDRRDHERDGPRGQAAIGGDGVRRCYGNKVAHEKATRL